MDSRDERLARNQTIFREVNERVAEVADAHGAGEPMRYEFFCECSDAGCMQRLGLTLGEYESIRGERTWFVIATGHTHPPIEQVVRRNDEYEVVQKLDEAAVVASESDPRS